MPETTDTASQDDTSKTSPFLGAYAPADDPYSTENQIRRAPQATHDHPTGQILAEWQTLEHGHEHEMSSNVFIGAVVVLIGIVAYAIYTNSPLMAIVFILIGMISYLSLNRDPEMIRFTITTKGISTGKEFYEYGHLRSFWIMSDHPDIPKELIIETSGALVSHVLIPLADQNVDAIRSLLVTRLSERKYEPGLIDTLGRILHI